MRRIRFLALSFLALAVPARGVHAHACASRAMVTPVPGDPRGFRITTPHGATVAHLPRQPGPAGDAGVLYLIHALDHTFDADFRATTVRDTLVVPVGATVRWQLVTGIHTVTNGFDSGDPTAGQSFSVLLTQENPTFDSTFTAPTTLNYFCYFHEPDMGGTLIVRANLSVPEQRPAAVRFTRPPAPNPARGGVAFTIGLPRAATVDIDVLDAAGARVAVIASAALGAGEHAFTWNGIHRAGRPAPPGVYHVRLRAGDVVATRAFSLIR